MRVRVKDIPHAGKWVGYYGQRRTAGDVFDLSDDAHFSERWMEKVEQPKPRGRPPKSAKVEKTDDDAE